MQTNVPCSSAKIISILSFFLFLVGLALLLILGLDSIAILGKDNAGLFHLSFVDALADTARF